MDLCRFSNLKSLDGPILVTGHTGFKGTWLTMLLAEIGVEVHGLSLPPEKDSMYERLDRIEKIPEVFLDINDRIEILKYLLDLKPSVLIHMAAQPLVGQSYIEPVETFMTNVMGTAHILDAALQTKSVKVVGVVTTDKVYENLETNLNFQETNPLGGKDPYSASKVGTEQAINAWRQVSSLNSGPAILSFRAGNVIGGGDYAPSRLLPDIIKGLQFGKKIAIRNPDSSRPWQHVLDPLFGYLLAIEKALSDAKNETYNFGPEAGSLTVAEVTKIVIASYPKVEFDIQNLTIEDTFPEAINLGLNSSKARQLLGWNPKWTQEAAILATLNWWDNTGSKELSRKTIDEIRLRLAN